MSRSGAELRYELAAIYRDQLRAVEAAQQAQRVSRGRRHRPGRVRLSSATETRSSWRCCSCGAARVVSVRTFDLKDVRLPDDELVASFVGEYYARSSFVPHEVLVPTAIEAARGLEQMLSEQRGGRVPRAAAAARQEGQAPAHGDGERGPRVPREGARARGRAGAARSRSSSGSRCQAAASASSASTSRTSAAATRSRRSWRSATARPIKKRYRSFHVKQRRRRRRLRRDARSAVAALPARAGRRARSWELPDLLVVDGGKGQLAMAQRGAATSSASRACRWRRSPRRSRTCWASSWSTACTCPGARTRSSCARAARRCRSWRMRATRRTARRNALRVKLGTEAQAPERARCRSGRRSARRARCSLRRLGRSTPCGARVQRNSSQPARRARRPPRSFRIFGLPRAKRPKRKPGSETAVKSPLNPTRSHWKTSRCKTRSTEAGDERACACRVRGRGTRNPQRFFKA